MKTKTVMILLAMSLMSYAAPNGKVSGVNPLSLENIKSIEKLSMEQRQHLEVYRQIKVLKNNGKYSPQKCFEPKYKPFVVFITQLEPLVTQEAQAYEQKASEFFSVGNTNMQAVATKRMNMCKTMAKLCKDVKEAYNDPKMHSKLTNYMGIYSNYEYAMTVEGIKLPKRNWLTQAEANILITRLYRIPAAQKARPRQ